MSILLRVRATSILFWAPSALLAQYQNNPAVKMMGVISESGQIDIDRLYQAILPQVQGGEKITIQFPVIGGEYAMDKSDIEKIYKNIKG